MNTELIYQKILEKTNKNLNNGSISLDRAGAVSLFNEEQNKFVEWTLQKRNTTDIRDIQCLLDDKELILKEDLVSSSSFSLPKNYFDFSNIKVKATSGECSDYLLPVEIKSDNSEEVLFDEDNKPSFFYRETPYLFKNNTVLVYKDGFVIDKVILTYYRYPKQFNIEGFQDEEGFNSFNSEPEFDDKIVDRIISMVATSFDINNENLNKVQVDINRTLSKS